MLLDTNNKEKAFTMQHERYAKDANKCLEKAIAINSGLLLPESKITPNGNLWFPG